MRTALALGLEAVAIAPSTGVHGRGENDVFFARLEIPLPDSAGTARSFSRQLTVQGAPGLEAAFERRVGPEPDAPTVVALIGRDFLRHCRLIYDGPKGLYALQPTFQG